MKKYESKKTARGNIGVSYESQGNADAQAARMDATDCTDCMDCLGCTDCMDCLGCTDCMDCTGCTCCTDCMDCLGCTDCMDCLGCTDCMDCMGCTCCMDCMGCTDCMDCMDCTDCMDCLGCTDCMDCMGCMDCKNKKGEKKLGISVATSEQSIENLDKVREIILDNQARLEMGHWHSDESWLERTCAEETICETTHCLAGWLQVCSTDKDVRKVSPQSAGFLCAPVAAKMFFRKGPDVLDWLQNRRYVEEIELRNKRLAEIEAKRT